MNAHDSGSSAEALSLRLSDSYELPCLAIELDHHRLLQLRVRDFVEEDDPAVFRGALPRPGTGDVDDFEIPEAALAGDGEGAAARFDGEDAPRGARGVFEAGEGDEEDGAEDEPAEVERPPASWPAKRETAKHGCYDTDRDAR